MIRHLIGPLPFYCRAPGRVLAQSPGLLFFLRGFVVLAVTLHLIRPLPLYRRAPGRVLAHSPGLRFFRRDLIVLAAIGI